MTHVTNTVFNIRVFNSYNTCNKHSVQYNAVVPKPTGRACQDHKLNLINKPEYQPTFYSRRWYTTSTPDLAFCIDDIDGQINRKVMEQLGGSDHRPVLLRISTYISCESTLPRWNYNKADWTLYSKLTDQVTKDIKVEGRDINKVVKDFNVSILTAAHMFIPRGARQNYKPYWSEELERLDEELSTARREAETNPSQDNHSYLPHTNARFLRYTLLATRISWRNKTTSLNLEKDGY